MDENKFRSYFKTYFYPKNKIPIIKSTKQNEEFSYQRSTLLQTTLTITLRDGRTCGIIFKSS